MKWDVWIIYAAEEKLPIAGPLVQALKARNYQVGEKVLAPGFHLEPLLAHGLAEARYAVLILSPAVFRLEGMAQELARLEELEDAEQRLFVLHWRADKAAQPAYSGLLPTGASPRTSTADRAIADLVRRIERADSLERASPPLATETSLQETTELAAYSHAGRSGRSEDVDFLMAALETAGQLEATRLADYALGLVRSQPGRERIEHYLFHGTARQRNYAALYFKRRGQRGLLQRAVEEGYVDEEQAFSK